jgi:hypothetical protein
VRLDAAHDAIPALRDAVGEVVADSCARLPERWKEIVENAGPRGRG